MGNSDDILAFDCGGQQWVLETAFPAGTRTCVPFLIFWFVSFRSSSFGQDLGWQSTMRLSTLFSRAAGGDLPSTGGSRWPFPVGTRA